MKRLTRSSRRVRRLPIFARTFGVTAAILALVGGVTYASLQSQQIKLTGNTIETATANLQISQDGVTYSNSQAGFAFTGIVPGGQAMPVAGYTFWLKNSGGAPLALQLSLPNGVSNTTSVDLKKVHIMLTPTSGGAAQDFTLDALTANLNGVAVQAPAALSPGTSMQYTIRVAMDADAVTGSGASLTNIDLAFRGTVNAN